jgi:hypothetical protein
VLVVVGRSCAGLLGPVTAATFFLHEGSVALVLSLSVFCVRVCLCGPATATMLIRELRSNEHRLCCSIALSPKCLKCI